MQRAETAAAASPRATSAGATTAAFPGQCDRIQAQTSEQKRRRGAPLGNRRAWRHGQRSAAAVERRKAGAVARKMAASILAGLRLLPGYRCRPRPIRADQHRHLDGEVLQLLQRLGVPGLPG
jgi:hypothetical protein